MVHPQPAQRAGAERFDTVDARAGVVFCFIERTSPTSKLRSEAHANSFWSALAIGWPGSGTDHREPVVEDLIPALVRVDCFTLDGITVVSGRRVVAQ